jgi:succinyl-diaminopimelate desuccinylase
MPMINDRHKDILGLSSALIRFRSTENDTDAQQRCIDAIVDSFKDTFNVKRYDINDHPAIVLSANNAKDVDIIISGHIDVVNGDDEVFSPIVAGDKLYGRGAYDMKASLAACLYAAADYVKNGGKKKIAIMITADEESGGAGTQFLLKHEKYTGELAIITDGGSDSQIVLKQKGVLHIKVAINGTSAHGAYPWLGENAIIKAHKLYETLIQEYLQPHHNDQWKTSITLSRIESSNSINQVPGTAYMYLDIRYTDHKNYEDIIDKIIEYTGQENSVQIMTKLGLFYSDTKNPYIQQLAKSMETVNDKKVTFEYENGASDAVFFTDNNIPAALFRPTGGHPHRNDEWVSISSLHNTYKIILNFLNNL